MKKIVLTIAALTFILSTATEAYAQVALANGIISGIRLASRAGKKGEPIATNTTTATYRGQTFPMQRTPAAMLPKKGAEQVTAIETQLDRFHTALLADSTSELCTPEQRTAIQSAMVNLARAQSSWDLQAYQKEATFYLAEDARRKKATTK
ncbi:hypothetical protein [Hymenobacter negativus]|uniref:DUF4142 domain-containing protein n=1 Tax=Hymenobacter negativus TaxID=2795026 RepID=A0ABS0QB53_9BACT|nr:hypothetical protein [Hymenobacter negativus]MBH8559904.1 hypothetical protein [Hymenobacter negativus]